MNFKDKVVVITGGVRDIGREVSLKFARLGANVVMNYFDNPEDAETTLAMVKAEGAKGIIVPGDMTRESDTNKVVEEACKAFGDTINVLLNVAGGLVGRKKVTEMEVEFWDFLMNVNAKTVFLMTKAVVPQMTHGGSIINFSSQAARDGGGPGASAYATAKGAVLTYTRSMAKELGPQNIRVNALCPGMISTSFHDRFTNDKVRENVAASTPLCREGEATEIADLVAYLASEESSFVTGTAIDINGGLYFS